MKLLFTFTENKNIKKETADIAKKLAAITKEEVAYTLNFETPHSHVLCNVQSEEIKND